jgi:hypothetical protein
MKRCLPLACGFCSTCTHAENHDSDFPKQSMDGPMSPMPLVYTQLKILGNFREMLESKISINCDTSSIKTKP